MEEISEVERRLDELAAEAGGYFAMPTEDDIAFTGLLLDLSKRFRIHYYSAAPEERRAVEEAAQIAWERRQEGATVEELVEDGCRLAGLTAEAEGRLSGPAEETPDYDSLFADICRQFKINYSSATDRERYFVEEVARVTWERQLEQRTGIKRDIRPAFSA